MERGASGRGYARPTAHPLHFVVAARICYRGAAGTFRNRRASEPSLHYQLAHAHPRVNVLLQIEGIVAHTLAQGAALELVCCSSRGQEHGYGDACHPRGARCGRHGPRGPVPPAVQGPNICLGSSRALERGARCQGRDASYRWLGQCSGWAAGCLGPFAKLAPLCFFMRSRWPTCARLEDRPLILRLPMLSSGKRILGWTRMVGCARSVLCLPASKQCRGAEPTITNIACPCT